MANIFRPSTWIRTRAEMDEGSSRNMEGVVNERAMASLEDDRALEFASPGARLRSAMTTRRPIEEIERRAYFKWQEAGCPHGQDVEYWLTAEREVLEEMQRPR